jgi:signal transduction histidine kinase
MSTLGLTRNALWAPTLGYVNRNVAMLAHDAAIPAALAVLATVELVSLRVPGLPAAIAVEVGACVLLVWRKRWPLIMCTAAGLVLVSLPYIGPDLNEPAVPILVVALASFSLGRYVPRHRGLLSMAAVFLALLVTQQLTLSLEPDISDAMFLVVMLVPPYLFGWLTRRLDESHAGQTRLLTERQEAVRREAVAAERSRIARELHDVLAHSVSAMVVQAEAASELIPKAPNRAVAALSEVTATGRASLNETRRLLGLIRDTDDELGLSPGLGLNRLPDLVEGFRRSGLRVDLVVDGSLESLPTGVDLSGYRIAQEALTNALKHASDRSAVLTVSRTPRTLTITTTNRADGTRRYSGDEAPAGLGMVGMRERAAMLGGRVSHQFKADGTFELTADLPLATRRR